MCPNLDFNLNDVEEAYDEDVILGMLEDLEMEALDEWGTDFVADMLHESTIRPFTEKEVNKIKELHEEHC